MNEMPDLISTPVITEQWDVFWKEKNLLINSMSPCDTLVISQPLDSDGQDKAQLKKMMQACQLEGSKYNIVELPSEANIAWHQIRDSLKPKYVILLGIDLLQLGVSITLMPHQVGRFDQVCWIPTLSIPMLEEQPDVKKHLWQYGLKPVFVDQAFG